MAKRPDLDQILGFLAVADELSFRRAAERLAMDQSALSRRIKALEERLGFPLVFRTTHAVRLTEAGRAFYDANRDVIGGIDMAVERARRASLGTMGRLRVAYMTFAAVELMPLAVKLFAAAHPEVSLELEYRPTLSQKLALAHGDIDVGLMLGPLDFVDYGTLSLGADPLVAVMNEAHPLAGRATLDPGEVAREAMVLGHRADWDVYRTRLDDVFALRGHQLTVAFEAPDLVGILGLVRAGLGVTILPRTMQRLATEGFAVRPIVPLEGGVATVAAWRRPAEARVSAFIRVLGRARAMLEAAPGGMPGG